MKSNPHVIWVGNAVIPALAVACSTCNAARGQPCEEWRYDSPDHMAGRVHVLDQPHTARTDYAETLGFRVRGGVLFDWAAPT